MIRKKPKKGLDDGRGLYYNISMIAKRVLALDIGDRRIGVAVSDPFNEYAMPCETYFRTRNFEADVAALAKLAQDKGVGVIVCGLPVNFDGTDSVQTEKTQRFIDALKAKTNLPIEIEDERFTTMQAREVQIAGGVKRQDRKKSVDSIAASYILDGYLARQKQKGGAQNGAKKAMNEELYEEELNEEDGIVYLVDDEGNEEAYVAIDKVDYKGAEYCVLRRAYPETQEDEEEVVIFRMETEGEDVQLFPVEDDALLDEVFAEFCNQYEDFEDADEAASLDS
ncbi:MAG: Holliday junction resolvase RuvX [Clostridia bacterium]|nr:Holliday junction resolvase RuvX [Clostridia bacterium]